MCPQGGVGCAAGVGLAILGRAWGNREQEPHLLEGAAALPGAALGHTRNWAQV